jgi:hypothetical protein
MISEKPQFAYGVERHLCETRWSSLHSIFNIQKIFPGLRTVDRKKPSSLTGTCQVSCATRAGGVADSDGADNLALHTPSQSAECLASPSARVGRESYALRLPAAGDVECPAVLVLVEMGQTGTRGVVDGAREEVYGGAECEPAAAGLGWDTQAPSIRGRLRGQG